MKPNIILAAIAGLILGVLAEFVFAFANRIPVLGCLVTPVALIFGLGLPILIGGLAALGNRGVSAVLDGAYAALLAELVSRLLGFFLSLFASQSFFFGPRFLLPSVEPAARSVFSGIWAIGWLVVSLIIAALLGALGAFLYRAYNRR